MKYSGNLSKMKTLQGETVVYKLDLSGAEITLNPFVGKKLRLSFTGVINCVHCGKEIKKSYNQGYCFPCTIKLAECDICIVRPELCHYDKGTCREPAWGEEHCLKTHVIYIANSSGLKVGITRATQVPTRWMDQGATQALPIMEVTSRLQSGIIETTLKRYINDKTDWRKMLKGGQDNVDLKLEARNLIHLAREELDGLEFEVLDQEVYDFNYPVLKYPEKVASISVEKNPVIEQTLLGIKGQYLIFEKGVINIRSHAGYQVELEDEYVSSPENPIS